MIDLHSHTILSDGVLLPSELARRAMVNGLSALAITDHVDHSNIDAVVSGLIKVTDALNKYWDIFLIPGCEITHVPVEIIGDMVKYARGKGAKVVVAHGESPVEPVAKGTNRAAIMAGADIVAHPGSITLEDAVLAAEKGVHLEITARKGHSRTNPHVLEMARKSGARLVLDTDSHLPDDMMTAEVVDRVFRELGIVGRERDAILGNSAEIVKKLHQRA
ncbi:MAG: histidinol phosphate phosphatase domain-containing protein [Candidatus Omnitrophica bacterium]|nr:histidinol phosphate phosphatase domain-containing protein [Candidatus Omnitrophota bacterium]